MRDELAKARAIAAAATPGPWHSDHDEVHGEWSVVRYGGSPRDYATDICDPESMTGADADHISRFDPPTVLAMLDAIELLSEAKLHVQHGTALRVDIDNALDRVRTLIGDDDERAI